MKTRRESHFALSMNSTLEVERSEREGSGVVVAQQSVKRLLRVTAWSRTVGRWP